MFRQCLLALLSILSMRGAGEIVTIKQHTQRYCLVFFFGMAAVAPLCQASNTVIGPSQGNGQLASNKQESSDLDALIATGKQGVKKLLGNGETADFRHLYINGGMDGPILCGEVKQTVADGSSSNYQRFVHDIGQRTLGFENESEAFPLTWSIFCD